jgi:hypothetical protein
LLPFSGKEALNLVDPLNQAILSQGRMEVLNLLCTSEDIKSTGNNRKVATEKLKTTTRLKK